MQAAAAAGSHSHSDSDSKSDRDMNHLRGAAHSSVVGGGNSAAVSEGNSTSAAGQLAMRHNFHYDGTQFVTEYDAINMFGLKHKNLMGLKFQRRYIPGVSKWGSRLTVSHLVQQKCQ
jgi:hypothetical protein